MAPHPHVVLVRDEVARYLRHRATLEDVRECALVAARAMLTDGMRAEDILVLLKGAVRLAIEHANVPNAAERSALIRSQIAGWVASVYLTPLVRETREEPSG